MMIRAAMVIGVAGLATTAFAQNFSLWLEPSSMTPTGTFTVSVYGDADVGTAYHTSTFGLSVASLGGDNQISNITWDLALEFAYVPSFDLGYGGNGTHLGIQFAHLPLSLCGGVFDCGVSYGELIGSFTIETDLHAMGDYQISLIAGPDVDPSVPYTFGVYDEMTWDVYNDSQGSLTMTGTTVTIVPAPAGIASLLICGLLSARRTREEAWS